MKPGKRILGATILVDGLAFLVFFALAAYERNANVIIPSYALKWELSKAFLDFAWWLPALQFLALSLALGSMAGKSENLLRDSILPGVLISALLAVLVLILAPDMETRRYSYLDRSGRFNKALADTRAALGDGRLVDARSSYGALASIDRLDSRAVELETRLVNAEIKAARGGGLRAAASVAAPLRDPRRPGRSWPRRRTTSGSGTSTAPTGMRRRPCPSSPRSRKPGSSPTGPGVRS